MCPTCNLSEIAVAGNFLKILILPGGKPSQLQFSLDDGLGTDINFLLRDQTRDPPIARQSGINHITTEACNMKPSQPLMARLRLTTKQVNRGYYKGNRTGSMGFFLKSSTYIIEPGKLRTYVVPENLDTFKLTPFVTKSFLPTRTKYTTEVDRNGMTISKDRAFNGEDYLDLWEKLNPREHDDWSNKWRLKRANLKAKAEADLEKVIKLDEKNKKKRKLKGGRTLTQLKKQGL